MKKLILILSFSLFFAGSYAQEKTPDNLLLELNNSATDSASLESLRQILNFWKTKTNDSTIFYSKKLIKESVKVNQIGKAYKGYYWLTTTFSLREMHDSVLYYSFKGLELFDGDSHYYPQCILLLVIGEQYRAMQQYDESIKYLNRAWAVGQKSDRKESLVGISNRLAAAYHENRQHDLAMIWADSSIALGKLYDNFNYVLNNRILRAAIMRDQGDYESALTELDLALKGVENDSISKIEILNNLAAIYRKLNDPYKTIEYAMPSYEISKKLELSAYLVVSTEFLASAYYDLGNYKIGFDYLKEYEILRHDLFFQERDAEISRLDAAYESGKKEMLIAQQEERIRQKEWELDLKNLILYIGLIVLIVFVFLSVNLLRIRKKLRQVNSLLVDRNEKIEIQKNDILGKAKEIEDAYIKLKELDKQKQAFINMLVHDLKNPLNLLVNLEVFEDEKEKKALVGRSSRQMLNMVMNILDVNASEEKDLKLTKRSLFLLDVIRSVVRDVDFLCVTRNIEIKYDTRYDYVFEADQDIIHRVFVNLLTNAIKFSPQKSIIRIEAIILENNRLKISVIDSGYGIDKNDQKRIFNKFEQLNETKSKIKGGTGLGLFFCKIAAEAHGWDIGVKSEVGSGAEFYLLIDAFKQIVKN